MGRNNSEFSNTFSKRHISFEIRMLVMSLLIIIMFLIAGAFFVKALNTEEVRNVFYDEVGEINYQVCLKSGSSECLSENDEYLAAAVGDIKTNFIYKANYSDKINYKYDYYVVGNLKIYDQEYPSEVLYSIDDVLVERTKVEGYYDKINLVVDVDIPYNEYNDYILQYENKSSLDAIAVLEVSLYVDDMESEKNISTLSIPIGNDAFNIEKKVLSYNNLEKAIEDSSFDEVNGIYASISVLFALFGLLILVRFVNFIVKTINYDTKYQKQLKHILKEYDRMIVTSRDGYSLNDNIRVIRVTSFTELKDARDVLERPIVYVRVNNVKSEFYVEDGDKVYLYIMKEADFQ